MLSRRGGVCYARHHLFISVWYRPLAAAAVSYPEPREQQTEERNGTTSKVEYPRTSGGLSEDRESNVPGGLELGLFPCIWTWMLTDVWPDFSPDSSVLTQTTAPFSSPQSHSQLGLLKITAFPVWPFTHTYLHISIHLDTNGESFYTYKSSCACTDSNADWWIPSDTLPSSFPWYLPLSISFL